MKGWSIVASSLVISLTLSPCTRADGDLETARQLLLQASHLGSKVQPPGNQVRLYQSIAASLVSVGDVAAAIQLARSSEHFQDDILMFAANRQVQEGDLDGAADTAELMKEETWHSLVLRAIVQAHVDKGDFAGALKSTELGRSELSEADFLGIIAMAQVKAGDLAAARRTASRASDDWERKQIFRDIASAQVSAGDLNGAMETATRTDDDWAVLAVARAQAKGGSIQAALETAALIEGDARAHALEDIAVAQAEMGDFKGALAVASTIPVAERSYFPPQPKYRALAAIAELQSRAADVERALDTVMLIPADEPACDVCRALRFDVLSAVGKAQAEQGDYAGAMRTSAMIKPGGYERADVLRAIAVTQGKAGDLAAAIETTSRIDHEEIRATAFQVVAEMKVQQDGQGVALAWSARLLSSLEKAYALLGIANGILAEHRQSHD